MHTQVQDIWLLRLANQDGLWCCFLYQSSEGSVPFSSSPHLEYILMGKGVDRWRFEVEAHEALNWWHLQWCLARCLDGIICADAMLTVNWSDGDCESNCGEPSNSSTPCLSFSIEIQDPSTSTSLEAGLDLGTVNVPSQTLPHSETKARGQR